MIVAQRRAQELLLRVTYRQWRYLYIKLGVIFTQKKVVKFHLENESKMCSSLNNINMTTGHR